MFVGLVRLELHIPGVRSLKAKRSVVKKVIDLLRSRYPLSVSETEYHDLWQKAAVGAAMVSNDAALIESVFEKAENLVVSLGVCEVTDVRREVFPW